MDQFSIDIGIRRSIFIQHGHVIRFSRLEGIGSAVVPAIFTDIDSRVL
jgi:hypothetical protein